MSSITRVTASFQRRPSEIVKGNIGKIREAAEILILSSDLFAKKRDVKCDVFLKRSVLNMADFMGLKCYEIINLDRESKLDPKEEKLCYEGALPLRDIMRSVVTIVRECSKSGLINFKKDFIGLVEGYGSTLTLFDHVQVVNTTPTRVQKGISPQSEIYPDILALPPPQSPSSLSHRVSIAALIHPPKEAKARSLLGQIPLQRKGIQKKR